MRKLVSLRNITDIQPIEGADLIEKVVVDGWQVVAQKGIHEVGKQVLFFEIDSFLPKEDERFESFMKFGIKTLDGKEGHRVRTIKLRKTYSQGVIMPIAEFPEIENPEYDTDYSETVGVVKYEKPSEHVPQEAKGNFPSFLRKSDQERIQNLYGKFSDEEREDLYVGTLKMDGSSVTVYNIIDPVSLQVKQGVCSRNLELKTGQVFEEPLEARSKFEQGVINSGLFAKIFGMCKGEWRNFAIQGELVGTGIQGTYEGFDTYQVFVYNIFDIDKQEFVCYNEFKTLTDKYDIKTVPEVYPAQKILKESLDTILNMSEGESINNKCREGIVWKQVDGTSQFKAISNKYLEKED